MDDILKYEKKKEDDYYHILGCDPLSTSEQIQAEFRVLAPKFHPDKNPDDPDAEKKFKTLQTARDVLCDPEQRAKYDKWRNSGISMPYEQWCSISTSMNPTFHWATPNTKERMLEAESASSSDPEEGGRIKGFSGLPGSGTGGNKRQQRRSSDFASTGRPTPSTGDWESDKSEVLRKFRNYEI